MPNHDFSLLANSYSYTASLGPLHHQFEGGGGRRGAKGLETLSLQYVICVCVCVCGISTGFEAHPLPLNKIYLDLPMTWPNAIRRLHS